MIGRPTEGRGHVFNLDIGNYDGISPTIQPTLLQLLSLLSVLLLLLLIYGLRSLRLKLSLLGKLGDKEALGAKGRTKESDKVGLLRSEKRNWWLIEAVVGNDEEERVQVDGRSVAKSQGYIDFDQSARWSFQDPQLSLAHAQSTLQRQTILALRQQPPPLSMAKLIMSRHANPPRRPRSPPAVSSPHRTSENVCAHVPQHVTRPPSRLSSHVEV